MQFASQKNPKMPKKKSTKNFQVLRENEVKKAIQSTSFSQASQKIYKKLWKSFPSNILGTPLGIKQSDEKDASTLEEGSKVRKPSTCVPAQRVGVEHLWEGGISSTVLRLDLLSVPSSFTAPGFPLKKEPCD